MSPTATRGLRTETGLAHYQLLWSFHVYRNIIESCEMKHEMTHEMTQWKCFVPDTPSCDYVWSCEELFSETFNIR